LKNKASFRLSAIRAALACISAATSAGAPSLVVSAHRAIQRSNSAGALSSIFDQAKRAMFAVLDRHTLADILGDPER
jgi:hypothetical protein